MAARKPAPGWMAAALAVCWSVACGSTTTDGAAASTGTLDAGTGSGGGRSGGGGSGGGGSDGGALPAPVKHTITIEVRGQGAVRTVPGGECRQICTVAVEEGATISFGAVPDTLQKFLGWTDACGGQGACAARVDRDLHVVATFAPQDFTVTIVFRGEGEGRIVSTPPGLDCKSSAAVCSAVFPATTEVMLTATPDLLSKPAPWDGDCRGPSCALRIAGDKVAVASFDLRRYAVVDLGTPAGGHFSAGTAISHDGRFLAGNWAGETSHPFLWDGVMHDTGVTFETYVSGVSEAGAVGGSFFDKAKGAYQAFRWQRGVFQALPTLGGGQSWVNGITPGGILLGWSTRPDWNSRAVYWEDKTPVELGALDGAICSYAYGADRKGVIVGESCAPSGGTHAVLWWGPNRIQDLGTLGGTYGRAYAINDAGVIVGSAGKIAGEPRPMFLADGRMIDVGLVRGKEYGQLTAVNQAGIAVGTCWSADNSAVHGVVAISTRILDLNTRVGGTPYEIVGASGIDDAGNIVGAGLYQGQWRALILRPE